MAKKRLTIRYEDHHAKLIKALEYVALERDLELSELLLVALEQWLNDEAQRGRVPTVASPRDTVSLTTQANLFAPTSPRKGEE
jgi:hypothetical protein